MEKKNINVYIITAIACLFIGISGTIAVYRYLPEISNNTTTEKTNKTVSVTEENSLKEAIDKVYNAVVLVQSYRGETLVSTGTGFIYKKDNQSGYVMTNHHVIESATTVKVKDINGNQIDAKVLGGDEYSDIAVLSIDAKAVLKVAEIGDSEAVELGDTIFTVGSPLGEEYMGTVTKGILSGKNRSVDTGDYVMDVLQTDAAMNPGNSGGPLVNIDGQVIGVNSLKLVEDEIEGMGFAIPIEVAMSAAEQLEKGEKIARPMVGVQLSELNNLYALYRSGIQIDNSVKSGIVVVGVDSGTPAADAGLQKGDVIVEFGGKEITSISTFRYQLYKYNVGDKAKLKINRNGKEQELEIYLNKES